MLRERPAFEMPASTFYVACYDVTSDSERDRVTDVLEGYGFRVQKSVFECRLTRSAKEKLLQQLAQLELRTGFVFLYTIGSSARRKGIGTLPSEVNADDRFSIIV